MADNYLENKMEEHRRRQSQSSGASAARRSGATTPDGLEGRLVVNYPVGLRVFVTGGASGIGRAIVKAFRSIGARVDFADIDRTRGTQLAQASGARFMPVDVSHPEQIIAALRRTIADRGDVDVIVNNAGVFSPKPLEKLEWTDFDRVMNINLRPAVITAHELSVHRSGLAEANPYGGRIINIASTRASMSEGSTEAYTASKGAMKSLTHSLMMSLSKWGITVNSISPGWIECSDYSQLTDEDHGQHPSGRVGRPDDIARIALFLAHPANNFINGIDIVADGGMTHRMIYEE